MEGRKAQRDRKGKEKKGEVREEIGATAKSGKKENENKWEKD